jgi:hypothetical protein
MGRGMKQLLYGGGYLALFLVIGVGVYFVFIRAEAGCANGRRDRGEQGVDCGGACPQACLPGDFRALEVAEQVRLFFPAEGKVSILARVQNPNLTVAARSFDHIFTLFDTKGAAAGTARGASFIYGGEIKYLTAFADVPAGVRVRRAELSLANPLWVLASEFPKPLLALQDLDAEAVGEASLRVAARVVNRDTAVFPTITAMAIFYNSLNIPVGVSETIIDNLAPGEGRTFTILHPFLNAAVPSKTDVLLFARRP